VVLQFGALGLAPARTGEASLAVPSTMDTSALLHMNEDHADALLDYARHYGDADYAASRAQLTPNTKQTSMEISYCSGLDNSTKTTTVPLVVRDGVALRQLLIEMAAEASIARVPAFQFSPPAVSLFLLTNLLILGVIAHAPREALLADAQLSWLWRPALAAMDVLGGRAVGQGIFYVAVAAHVAEGWYVASRLLAAKKPKTGRGNARVAAWALQTALVGYPSLTLVLGKLRAAELAEGKKSD
jgi:folate-binding Fe-S cluster repair protein YgfZ